MKFDVCHLKFPSMTLRLGKISKNRIWKNGITAWLSTAWDATSLYIFRDPRRCSV